MDLQLKLANLGKNISPAFAPEEQHVYSPGKPLPLAPLGATCRVTCWVVLHRAPLERM